MRNSIKLMVVATFGIFGLGLFLSTVGASGHLFGVGNGDPTPTPPRNSNVMKIANGQINSNAPIIVNSAANMNAANMAANMPMNANVGKPAAPVAGGKTIPKKFTLGKDSLSEYGEASFDHETHAFANYSPDGKSVVGCVECHHTDQPKSALKPPLLSSERDILLTFASWQASSQKVSECRAFHFQEGNVPDGKEMPTATYTEGGKSVTKTLNNELAYHINCNTCHDAAFKARPELKKKPGFATTKDCTICHKSN
ncbi:MAG: cytochrome c3 family protein [Pyrinomonadaceae bacterium]